MADCSKNSCILTIIGRVQYARGDGAWVILGDNGCFYAPLNLPPALQVEGLRARFRLQVISDLWGTKIVNILRYNRVGNRLKN